MTIALIVGFAVAVVFVGGLGVAVSEWQVRADYRDKARGCICPPVGATDLFVWHRNDCPIHGRTR